MGQVGRPPTVTDEELLDAIREAEGVVVSAREVSEYVDLSQRCVHSRLTSLAEEETVETKALTERARVWWLPDE